MRLTNIEPMPSWYHGKDIAGFRLGDVPYFSVSQVAHELGTSVFSDFDLVADFLIYKPFVMMDRTFGPNDEPEIFMPLPALEGWVCQRDINDFSDAGKDWFSVIWQQITQILETPQMQKATFELIEEMRAHGDEPS